MDKEIMVPVEIFRDRDAAVLESLVMYLKDTYKLSYADLGRLMNRDQKTLWTVYMRARRKKK